jgi:hypothetical protein
MWALAPLDGWKLHSFEAQSIKAARGCLNRRIQIGYIKHYLVFFFL